MPTTNNVIVRPAVEADLPAINAIFNHYVVCSTCIWARSPWSDDRRRAWFAEHGPEMPVLVAEAAGRVVGWASLSAFRPAYTRAGTLEDSIYVHPEQLRQGVGAALLAGLIDAARDARLHSILAVISAEQEASISLHAKFGFVRAGHLRQVGRKFDRWLDAVYMQLMLNGD